MINFISKTNRMNGLEEEMRMEGKLVLPLVIQKVRGHLNW
jgi:hypothetical protein